MSTKLERELFEEWKTTLPQCLGDGGGCDGDLVGVEHAENCPMRGKEFATHFDAFRAGRRSMCFMRQKDGEK